MAEATNVKKAGTGKSGLGMILLAIGVIALIGVIIWVLTNPDILAATLTLIIVIVIAIVIIALIIAGIMMIIAIPVYVAKGEQYQEGVDYKLDDVKPVKESSSEDDKEE
jgi:prepilin signal peptidase PulO-like enzyme (type II secretory pathway)